MRKSAYIFIAKVALSAILPVCATAAEFASIAWTANGKSGGWAVSVSQEKADKLALYSCNSTEASKKDCSNSVTKAVVRAESANHIGMSSSHINVADAKRTAIDQCGQPDCKVLEVYDYRKPGFIAVARTAKQDSPVNFYTAWGFTDSNRAHESALEGCRKKAGEPCNIFYSGAIPGPIPVHAAAKTIEPAPMAATNPRSCRPTTATVKCDSKCVNGNCVLEYANGCKIRVRVESNFNPTNNTWEHPLPSC